LRKSASPMINVKNQSKNFNNIRISSLKLEDLQSFIKIEFDAFYEKLKFIFSSRKDAALNIITEEITANIGTGRYYNARMDDKMVGIIEIVTRENIKAHNRNFKTYVRYLGFLRAIKAFVLNLLDAPRLDGSTVYIDNVAVDIDNRRKGVARIMLSFVEDFAKRHGKNALTLWVAAANKSAYGLYKKFGFKNMVTRSSRIAERHFQYRDWVYMKKEI